MKRFVLILLCVVLLLYLAACIALYTQQRRLLYVPPNAYLAPQAVGLSGFSEIALEQGGQDIAGWWSPPLEQGGPVIMFFHGNGSAVFSNHDIYRELQSQGYGVYALAYPGYPGRTGSASQDSLTQAAVQAYDSLITRGIAPENIVFYGTSLGGGLASQLAAMRAPKLLILESTFTSITDVAQLHFRLFPAKLLVRDKFDSAKTLQGSKVELLWIHGTADRIVPFRIGQKLFEEYDGPKEGHVIEGGYHTDSWHRGGREIILNRLASL